MSQFIFVAVLSAIGSAFGSLLYLEYNGYRWNKK